MVNKHEQLEIKQRVRTALIERSDVLDFFKVKLYNKIAIPVWSDIWYGSLLPLTLDLYDKN